MHLQIIMQPKTQEAPFADLQNVFMLECTFLLTYILTPLPPSLFSLALCPAILTILAFPNTCLYFLISTKVGSVLVPPPCTAAYKQPLGSTVNWCHRRAYLICFHSLRDQSDATCHPMSKNHCLHIYMFSSCLRRKGILLLHNKLPPT